MRTLPLTTLATTLLAATLLLGGCQRSSPAPAQATQGASSATSAPPQEQNAGALNSDGTRSAPSQQPSASPTAPVPASASQAAASNPLPVPAAPQAAPAPAPPPPPPTVPAGTLVAVRVTERLSASQNEVGDPFTGTLAEPLVHHGTVVFPRGTRVAGTIVAAKGRGRFKGSGALGIELTSIGGIRARTSEYEQEDKGRGQRSAGFIGGGTGLGAILGGIAGGGKGALIGGLAGAGAGTAGAAFTGKRDVIIPSESLVRFRLTQPLAR